ncbi:glutaredoxin-3 [Neodiprion fabricii]|uniref:glutaredoxin-3 n=1 Tax=Neodiprion fabricii TaxID=2872261 RepID=UPI001ED91581|nr:glutaredoxin-3 [Neodiprion fabricii]
MAVTNLATVDEFNTYIKSKDLTVIHFYAAWAAQCAQINDVLEEMGKSADYKGVNFAKIAAEDVPEVSLKFGVSAVPTILLLRNSVITDRVDGANPAELATKVKQQMSSKDPVPIEIPKPKENIEERLKKLINHAPCMLFMKGNPANPRCGFSRTIISVLDSYNADYQTFDILQDNDVREGLKKFSNWPTYPQLYLNGELLGGLDIVREMGEAGELEAMLPKKVSLEERVREVIARGKTVIVMKGTKEEPKCVYTKQIMEIFDAINVPYETFDILMDEELRIALKSYYDWPTYPHVYVDGELIGGFETVKDLYESGELIDTLYSDTFKGNRRVLNSIGDNFKSA